LRWREIGWPPQMPVANRFRAANYHLLPGPVSNRQATSESSRQQTQGRASYCDAAFCRPLSASFDGAAGNDDDVVITLWPGKSPGRRIMILSGDRSTAGYGRGKKLMRAAPSTKDSHFSGLLFSAARHPIYFCAWASKS
jgi:hypothetical protein